MRIGPVSAAATRKLKQLQRGSSIIGNTLKRMKAGTTSLLARCAVVLALPVAASLGDPSPSSSPGSSAAAGSPGVGNVSSANRPIAFHGVVVGVEQTAKTFTVSGKQKSHTFKVTDRTVITKGAQSASMRDISADEEVSGSYWKQTDGSLEARMVKIGPVSPAKPAKTSASPSATASIRKP